MVKTGSGISCLRGLAGLSCSGWPGYEITFRRGSAAYQVVLRNAAGTGRGVCRTSVDGTAAPGAAIELVDDGRERRAEVALEAQAGDEVAGRKDDPMQSY